MFQILKVGPRGPISISHPSISRRKASKWKKYVDSSFPILVAVLAPCVLSSILDRKSRATIQQQQLQLGQVAVPGDLFLVKSIQQQPCQIPNSSFVSFFPLLQLLLEKSDLPFLVQLTLLPQRARSNNFWLLPRIRRNRLNSLANSKSNSWNADSLQLLRSSNC